MLCIGPRKFADRQNHNIEPNYHAAAVPYADSHHAAAVPYAVAVVPFCFSLIIIFVIPRTKPPFIVKTEKDTSFPVPF